MARYRILDAHCHLHEYSDEEIEKEIANLGIAVIAVSDDAQSSRRTLELAERYSWVIPALGLHPWEVEPDRISEVDEIIELVRSYRVRILGEIGLDKRFRRETYMYQLEVFKRFLEVAKEMDLAMTLHCVDAWREVLDLVSRASVRVAVFHWYTGPVELLQEIKDRGFYISINPAIVVQDKHKLIAKHAPEDIMLVESDGPYNYRGTRLGPHLIDRAIEEIARVRNDDPENVRRIIVENSRRFLKEIGIALDIG